MTEEIKELAKEILKQSELREEYYKADEIDRAFELEIEQRDNANLLATLILEEGK